MFKVTKSQNSIHSLLLCFCGFRQESWFLSGIFWSSLCLRPPPTWPWHPGVSWEIDDLLSQTRLVESWNAEILNVINSSWFFHHIKQKILWNNSNNSNKNNKNRKIKIKNSPGNKQIKKKNNFTNRRRDESTDSHWNREKVGKRTRTNRLMKQKQSKCKNQGNEDRR